MRTACEESSAQEASAWMGPGTHLAGLKAELSITQNQSGAWGAYVATVLSNRQRMEVALGTDAPSEHLPPLAALVAMRRAGSQLYGCLTIAARSTSLAHWFDGQVPSS